MAVSTWTEIVYNSNTRALIAVQEFSIDRGNDHDWSLMKDQSFVRINKSIMEDIIGKRMNITLDDVEPDPAYVPPINKKQEEIDTINAASTIDDIKAILLQNTEEKYT